MRPCRASDAYAHLPLSRYLGRARKCTAIYAYSTSATTSAAEAPAPKHHALTLLHKTRAFLPYVLPSNVSPQDAPASLEFWEPILADMRCTLERDLSSKPKGMAKATVAVFGLDEWAGSQDLLSALLRNPFASKDDQHAAVLSRWEQVPLDQQHTVLDSSIESSWIDSFNTPLEILEFRPSSSAISSPTTWATAKKADISILLINPLSTPLSSLPSSLSLLAGPNTVIVIGTAPPPEQLAARIKNDLIAQNPGFEMAKILFIDTQRAASSVESIRSGSSSAIQSYQDSFLSSNITSLTRAISSLLPVSSAGDGDASARHTRTAASAVQSSLRAARLSLSTATGHLSGVYSRANQLKDESTEARARAQSDVLRQGAEVSDAMESTRQDIWPHIERLSLWNAIWRVDEIGQILNTLTSRTWGSKLENRLLLHTGRLTALQKRLTTNALTLSSPTATAPSSPGTSLVSPLLSNKLAQLQSSLTYPIFVRSLTSPIDLRRSQIITFLNPRLARDAQRVSITSLSSMLLGLGSGAYGAIAAMSAEFGNLPMAIGNVPGEALVGVGVFSSLFGIRWAMSSWERAKRKWWRDVERISDGLGRDLESALDDTMSKHVTVVADAAVAGISELADKRRAEIRELSDTLEGLEKETQCVVDSLKQ